MSSFRAYFLNRESVVKIERLNPNPTMRRIEKPRFVLITVVVDEYSPARQVGEHQTAVACGNMQMIDSRIIQVLPMRDQKHS